MTWSVAGWTIRGSGGTADLATSFPLSVHRQFGQACKIIARSLRVRKLIFRNDSLNIP
jgi:hypothetical protein